MSETNRLVPPYRVRTQTSFNLSSDSTFVFDIAVPVGAGNKFAASSSDNCIKIYSKDTVQLQTTLAGPRKRISGITGAKTNPNLLWSCSEDPSVTLWDLRTGSAVTQYQCGNILPTCCDVSCDDQFLAVGTELDDDEDAPILVWDVRSQKPAGTLPDSHSDDITQIVFHPVVPNIMASGSTDGLVNVTDIKLLDQPDDATLLTLNAESSIGKLGYFGPNGEYIYGLTHDESYMMWHATERENEDETELILKFPNLRENLASNGIQVDYFIESLYHPNSQRLFLIGGTHDGRVEILHVSSGSISLASSLYNGHSSTVRAIHWSMDEAAEILTAGEDSNITVWTWKDSTTEVVSAGKMLAAPQAKQTQKIRRSPY